MMVCDEVIRPRYCLFEVNSLVSIMLQAKYCPYLNLLTTEFTCTDD